MAKTKRKKKARSNPAPQSNPVFNPVGVLTGVAIGGLLTYVVVSRIEAKKRELKQQEEEKKLLEEAAQEEAAQEEATPEPEKEAPQGRRPPHLQPIVVPKTADEVKTVQEAICAAFDKWQEVGEGEPELDDLVQEALKQLYPSVDWPSEPGDDLSVVRAEGFVWGQLYTAAFADPQKSISENLTTACPKQAVFTPKEGG